MLYNCEPCTRLVLGDWRQVDPRDLLTRWFSRNHKLLVQRETLSHSNFVVDAKEEDTWCPLMSSQQACMDKHKMECIHLSLTHIYTHIIGFIRVINVSSSIPERWKPHTSKFIILERRSMYHECGTASDLWTRHSFWTWNPNFSDLYFRERT